MRLPAPVIEAMAAAGDGAAEVGIQLCLDVADALRDRTAGVYLIPAFRRYTTLARIIEQLRA